MNATMNAILILSMLGAGSHGYTGHDSFVTPKPSHIPPNYFRAAGWKQRQRRKRNRRR